MAYQITEVLNDIPGKFVYMVSFNGGAPERFEIELDKLPESIANLSTDAEKIDALLEKVSDDAAVSAAEAAAQIAAANSLKIVDGKVVL